MLAGELRNASSHTIDVKRAKREAKMDAKDRARQNLESVGFDFYESEQYIEYVEGLPQNTGKIRGGFRWLYIALAGLCAGMVAVMIQFLLIRLNELKFDTQQHLFENEYSLGVRYLVWLGTCLVLVSIAGALVCYVEPLAGGSGIPEIKCILNGIDMPNVLTLKTLGCKAFGIVCSVGAGLPCGKEGPMIHSGAICATQATFANAGPLIRPYRRETEARDFTAAGAAAGVAAAFGAPIGGVLFAVEEGASHMNPTILVRTFVCASVAAFTVRFFAGPMEHGPSMWGTLGTEVPVEFGRFDDRKYRVWELPVFGLMGICGGLLGALFNFLNTKLSKWRMRNIGARGHKRFAEVLVLTMLIVSFNFFAPVLCGSSSNIKSFEPAQRLFVDVGGHAIRELFHNEERIDTLMLLFFALAHYVQTVLTYGLGVPSGLFVPSLLAGASLGRLVGQGLNHFDAFASHPGTYALIGATAMLSGMARITISLVVILMETTGEAEWCVPIFITVMLAKWIGDRFNKGIYDIHIDLRHVPVLEHRAEKHLLALQAKDIMVRAPTTLDSIASIRDLMNILGDSRHHAFPVVDRTSQTFEGLLERNTLLHILLLGKKHGAFSERSTASHGVVPFSEMVRHHHPDSPPFNAVEDVLNTSDYDMFVDLLPYANKGCYTLQEHAAGMRCYGLFRTMGLRHLPVLGNDHKVRGIITRKDLLKAAEGDIDISKPTPLDDIESARTPRISNDARIDAKREEQVQTSDQAQPSADAVRVAV